MVGPAAAGMVTRRRHTAELTPAELAEARALMDVAFDDFTDHDWDHALGGVHALVVEDGRLLAHAALVQRRLLHDDRSLRCGYVEAVAVHPEARRRGLGTTVLRALEELAPAYHLLALCSTDDGVPLYRALGWTAWRGATHAMTAGGLVRTPDADGAVYVRAAGAPLDPPLDLDGDLACDWRDGDLW